MTGTSESRARHKLGKHVLDIGLCALAALIYVRLHRHGSQKCCSTEIQTGNYYDGRSLAAHRNSLYLIRRAADGWNLIRIYPDLNWNEANILKQLKHEE